jgi:glutamyl-tRNA reductase
MLSTCDRVAAIGMRSSPEWEDRIETVLAGASGVAKADIAAAARRLAGIEALDYLFALASSLKSRIVGEPQVLGQLKSAHRAARERGHVGGNLDAALAAAYATAKRVRHETKIGEGPVSLAAVAVDRARELHGDLSKRTGLLFGTGDMGLLLAKQLLASGLGGVVSMAAQSRRAEAIARELGGHFADADSLAAALEASDIVVTCQGSGQFAVTQAQVEEALRRRRRRPIFFADLGVPKDVEPAVNALDGAFLYDLDDLERLALAGMTARQQSVDRGRAIVKAEVGRFLSELAERAAVPEVIALRRHFEAMRDDVLNDTDDAARATELLIRRLLHAPSAALRRMAGEDPEAAAAASRLIDRLFGLGGPGHGDENGRGPA